MPESLMRLFVRISLILFFAIPGALPLSANEISADEGLAIDVLDDTCVTPHDVVLDEFGQAAATFLCEPLPVALDLRFMDDDYDSPAYGLPVVLDLDWESGEP